MREKILSIIEKDARLTVHDVAAMMGVSDEEVANEIAAMEKENIICGYHTLINWENTSREVVTALIEVKATPQRGMGFDRIAERIYHYPEVDEVYLMSGSYDLACIVTGKTLREVARFVSEHLSALEDVTGTATHFILKRYKDKHVIYETKTVQEEGFVFS